MKGQFVHLVRLVIINDSILIGSIIGLIGKNHKRIDLICIEYCF